MGNVAPEEAPHGHYLLLSRRPCSGLCTTLHLCSFDLAERHPPLLKEFSYLEVRAAREQLRTLIPQIYLESIVVVLLVFLVVYAGDVLQEVYQRLDLVSIKMVVLDLTVRGLVFFLGLCSRGGAWPFFR